MTSESQFSFFVILFRRFGFRVCYICGREFGFKLFVIYEFQCLEKWRIENSKLFKYLRRLEFFKLLFVSGSGFYNFQVVNEVVFQSFQVQLLFCEFCGRTFLLDRFFVYQRSCKLKGERFRVLNFNSFDDFIGFKKVFGGILVRLRIFICYICGREFGILFFFIYEFKCLEKWKIENDRFFREFRRLFLQKFQYFLIGLFS